MLECHVVCSHAFQLPCGTNEVTEALVTSVSERAQAEDFLQHKLSICAQDYKHDATIEPENGHSETKLELCHANR